MGYLGVVQALLEKGADVSAKDNSGRTAQQRAAHYGRTEVTALLERVASTRGSARGDAAH
jgi:ankyrin repeat protein